MSRYERYGGEIIIQGAVFCAVLLILAFLINKCSYSSFNEGTQITVTVTDKTIKPFPYVAEYIICAESGTEYSCSKYMYSKIEIGSEYTVRLNMLGNITEIIDCAVAE